MDERTAMLHLALAIEPGTDDVHLELAQYGAVETLARIRGGRGPLSRSTVLAAVERAEVGPALARARQIGGRVLLLGEAEYPGALADLPEPPLALWVRGPVDLRMAALRSVAVVGARAATPYGEAVARNLSGDLAEREWVVVSGAAFGIDASAHRGALEVGAPTVAVLACGFDYDYPRAHDWLLAQIADTGAVVSELPPGAKPLKHRFLARNRVIAALTRGTVVVEAALRSGAMATANRALELGRPVMAVPGPVTSMSSAGCNRLLHECSARAVADCDQVVAVITGHSPTAGDGPVSQPDLGQAALTLPGEAFPESVRAVVAELPRRGGCALEEVAQRAGMDAGETLSALGLAELVGVAVRTPQGWRSATRRA
ncbi:MAG: DNA-processing protein DprA [Candidatus Nanopelagicales bacterium]